MGGQRRMFGLVLGLGLVLHGLGNAVLPLRGVDVSVSGTWMPAVATLYMVAIVGFVTAGLGVLGIRPLARAAVPAAIAAGLCAMAVQWRVASPDLWVGIALSASLPVVTILHVATLPRPTASIAGGRQASGRMWRRAGDALGIAFLLWVSVSTVAWPWHRGWGTTPEEWAITLPGDHTPRTTALELLHGVTIDAPPSAVWPWLVQLGQDRAGFYSYDWLERLFGADVHNVDEIRAEWQSRRVGDHVYATQPGYMGGIFGERPGWVVDDLEPEQALVLRNWGAFVLVPAPEGDTRLLIRSTISHERIPAWAAAINLTAFELPHFIMQRRMLLGIKARAERVTT